jgi:hypothetical protein
VGAAGGGARRRPSALRPPPRRTLTPRPPSPPLRTLPPPRAWQDLRLLGPKFTLREAALAFACCKSATAQACAGLGAAVPLCGLSFEDLLEALVLVATLKPLPTRAQVRAMHWADAGPLATLEPARRAEVLAKWEAEQAEAAAEAAAEEKARVRALLQQKRQAAAAGQEGETPAAPEAAPPATQAAPAVWERAEVLLELIVETMHARLGKPLHRTLSLDARRRMLTDQRVRKFVKACGRERLPTARERAAIRRK